MTVLHKCDACNNVVGQFVDVTGPAYRAKLELQGCKLDLFIPWQLLLPGWAQELQTHICTSCLDRASQAVVKELAQAVRQTLHRT